MNPDSKTLPDTPITFVAVTNFARSNREWSKVYQYLLHHPEDFFAILPDCRWSIAHQTVLHGDVDLFKRLLGLLSNSEVNIQSKTKDNKTLLDIAKENQGKNPEMFKYIKGLFLQDELIKAAKESNWNSVLQILGKHKHLTNEKPSYSPFFLIHYVIQNGDVGILQNLIDNFQCSTHIQNAQNETPLDMAIRLQKHDMCSILQTQSANEGFNRPMLRSSSSLTNSYQRKSQLTNDNRNASSNKAAHSMPASASPQPSTNSLSSFLGFGKILSDLNENGLCTSSPTDVLDKAQSLPIIPPKQEPIVSSELHHVHTTNSIGSEYPPTNLKPKSSISLDSLDEAFASKLKCPLTEEIFQDPVIASDGQTYERDAITEWINLYHCSPVTGVQMIAVFQENIEIQDILKSLSKKELNRMKEFKLFIVMYD